MGRWCEVNGFGFGVRGILFLDEEQLILFRKKGR